VNVGETDFEKYLSSQTEKKIQKELDDLAKL
jgi:hypothetical protein